MTDKVASTTGAIRLRCAVCGLPWLTVQGGAIIVQSTHSGDKHINTVSLEYLINMLKDER